jgi:uncharacterized protein (DUF2132 family)
MNDITHNAKPHDYRSDDRLHGVKLETIVNALYEKHGWAGMAAKIPAKCFSVNPSLKSSLTFLRKTPWARSRVEGWYLSELPR